MRCGAVGRRAVSGPCVRPSCPRTGTHVVFETSGGSVTGPGGAPGSGPLTGRLYACGEHVLATYDNEYEEAAYGPDSAPGAAVGGVGSAGGRDGGWLGHPVGSARPMTEEAL